ncbi:MAG: hypothetical protein ACYDCQ_17660 [Dehalococcoidia bacterium]
MLDTRQIETAAAAATLYERYAKPLEAEHWGEYVVVARDGRTVRAPKAAQAMAEAASLLGADTFLFRVGPIAVSGRRS